MEATQHAWKQHEKEGRVPQHGTRFRVKVFSAMPKLLQWNVRRLGKATWPEWWQSLRKALPQVDLVTWQECAMPNAVDVWVSSARLPSKWASCTNSMRQCDTAILYRTARMEVKKVCCTNCSVTAIFQDKFNGNICICSSVHLPSDNDAKLFCAEVDEVRHNWLRIVQKYPGAQWLVGADANCSLSIADVDGICVGTCIHSGKIRSCVQNHVFVELVQTIPDARVANTFEKTCQELRSVCPDDSECWTFAGKVWGLCASNWTMSLLHRKRCVLNLYIIWIAILITGV